MEPRRAKWVTLTTYQVTKLLFSSTKVPVTVSGVQFKKTDGSGGTFTANARKEVILAAGAIQTPALLQISGIGDPALLKSLGITTVVNLPTVGKNLQEQARYSPVDYLRNTDHVYCSPCRSSARRATALPSLAAAPMT